MRSEFASPQELFDAVDALATTLHGAGFAPQAARLRDVLGRLTGLTDGAALFLEALEEIAPRLHGNLDAETTAAFERIHRAVHRAVYRR